VAFSATRRDIVEQFFHRIFVPQNCERGPAGVKGTVFA
jgi:hypothetical protein